MKQLLRSLAITACVAFSFAGAQAQVITAEHAQEIANSFFSNGKQKSAAVRSTAAVSMKKSADSRILTSESSSDAPTFHIITPASGEGFVIVAGEEMENPIIGYSFEGTIDTNDLPVGFVDYMTDIDAQVKALRKYNAENPQKAAAARSAMQKTNYAATMGNIVRNLGTAPWGQNAPFNNLCPKINSTATKTGCGPTAFAILCHYYKWPEAGTGSVTHNGETLDLSSHNYDYENMLDSYNGTYTEAQATAVATLMRDLGYAYKVTYGTVNTEFSEGITSLKNYFSFNNSMYNTTGVGMDALYRSDTDDENFIQKIKECLDQNYPIPFSSAVDNLKTTGLETSRHIYILDGYTENNYFHFNWGWHGSYNGWFTLDNMNLSDNTGYSNQQRMYLYVVPNRASHTVTATVSPENAGTVSINGGAATGEYLEGATVTLAATVNTGYTFSNWTKGSEIVSTSKSCQVKVASSDNDYVANFLTVGNTTVNVTVSYNSSYGTVSGTSGTVANGTTLTPRHNEEVTLTATPADGYVFTGWTVTKGTESTNYSGTSLTFVATGEMSVTANFALAIVDYNMIIDNVSTSGSSTGSRNSTWTYNTDNNHPAALKLQSSNGSKEVYGLSNSYNRLYAYVYDANTTGYNTATYTLSVPDGYIITSYNLTYWVSNTGQVTVSNGTTTETPSDTKDHYLTASPNAQTAQFTISASQVGQQYITIVSFIVTVMKDGAGSGSTPTQYTITATANPGTAGSVTGGGTYNEGATVTLTATPNSGYEFVNWTSGTTTVSTSATYSFTANANASYVANFQTVAATTFAVTTTANPIEGGTATFAVGTGQATSSATVASGTGVTLYAVANDGYRFVNWTNGTSTISSEATANVTINANSNFVANFEKEATTPAVDLSGKYFRIKKKDTSLYMNIANTKENTGTTSGITIVAKAENNTQIFLFEQSGNGYKLQAQSGNYIKCHAWNANANATTATEATELTFESTGNELEYYIKWNNTNLNGNVERDDYFMAGAAQNDNSGTQYVYCDAASTAAATWVLEEVTLCTITANSVNGGTVTPETQTVEQGTSVTLTATPADGYVFVNWTNNLNTDEITENPYTVTATTDVTYTANFKEKVVTPTTYTITATASPVEGGTVTGGGTYNEGETITLEATPADGYVFANWTNNLNTDVVTENPYTVTATADVTYTAKFEEKVVTPTTYTITATANPTEGGTVTGGGTYTEGETVTLTATSNSGYTFKNWTNNLNTDEITENPYTVTATTDVTYTANFEKAAAAGGGTETVYNIVTNSTNGAISEQNPNTNENYFYKVWTSGVNVVPQIVITSSGYTITAVTDNELKLRAATYTLSLGNNVNEDLQIVSYTINYTKNASSSNITLSAEGEEEQTPGKTTDLQSFVVDSFDPTRSTSFTVTTGNLSQAIWVESIDITIRSSVKEYTITATANPTEGGTVTGGGTYDDGAKATLTAMPNANYSFVNWTKDGAVVNNSATYEVTVTADANYVANFNYTGSYVSIAADISTIGGSEGGTVTGTGKAIPGSTVTLTAVPNTGYRFAAWYNGEGQQISTNASYSFEATEDATYRAEFIKQVYVEITQPETTNETGVVNGYVFANTWIGPEMTTTTKTTVDYGTEVILNVIVYDEFNGKVTFAYWSLNGEKVSQEDSYTFTATEDSYYFLANFDYKAYVAVEAADGNGSVRIKGEDGPEAMVAVNNTVTIIAEAESEYVLDRWVKVNKDQSETYVSGNATYTFVFKADYDETVTYKAYFRKIEMLENGKAYRIIGIMSNGKKRYVYCDGNQLKWSSEKVDTDNSIFVVQSDLTNKGGYINLISAVGYYGWQNNADMGNNYAMIKTEVDSETGKFTLFAANGTSCLTYCVYDEDVNATNGTVISRESQTGPTKEVNDYGTTDFIFEEALFEFNVNIANGSNAKLGTINLPFATIVHPSVTAYKVTSSDENWVYVAPLTLTDNILPANTPVLVEADEAGTYGFAPAPARIGTYDTGFEGTLAPEDIPGTTNAYILSYEREETPIKLYKLASDDRTINANKAYYIDENGGASAISFKFAGTTCIDGVEGEYGEVQSIYDLQGRKLSEITEPGIYIVNGKKIMVK